MVRSPSTPFVVTEREPSAHSSPAARSALGSLLALSIFVSGVFSGCSATSGPTSPLVVAPTGAQQLLGTTPWPSDLFLQDGHVALTTLPTDTVDLTPLLLAELATEDGFGVTTGGSFPMSELPDTASLDGKIHLYDLGKSTEIPITYHVRPFDRPNPRVYVRPQNGQVLLEKTTYAYVMLRGPRGPTGVFQAAADLKAALANSSTRAGTIYKPLVDKLGTLGIASADIVAASVFTTHSVTVSLVAARAALQTETPAASVLEIFAKTGADGTLDSILGTPTVDRPGLDNTGGVQHTHIGFIVQGTMPSPNYLDAEATVTGAGGTPSHVARIAFDSAGAPMRRGTATVPFTLVIPDLGADAAAYANLKVAIFQHGLGGQRSALMAVADTLAAKNIATIGVDIPFHGSRSVNATDTSCTFCPTATNLKDGWAEVSGQPAFQFFDVMGSPTEKALDPSAIRSAFFQAAVDLAQEVRFLEVGNLSAIQTHEPRLAQLSLDHTRIAYSGESFGAIIGGITLAIEPNIGAAVLDVGGGGLIFPLLLNSATQGAVFGVLLDGGLGTSTTGDDPPDSDFAYNLLQMLLERGDPLAYAPYVIRSPLAGGTPKHVVQFSAHLDETVPNPSNEALASALGLTPVRLPAGGSPALDFWPNAPAIVDVPVSGNSAGTTAVFLQMEEASHGMLTTQHGAHTVDVAHGPPFQPLGTPVPIANPTDRLQKIYGEFISGYLNGQTPQVISGN